VPLPWIIAGAAVGLLACPRIRASVFLRGTRADEPPRRACPAFSRQVLPDRWRWWPVLPVTGRCPSCRTRIGPYPLLAEFAAGLRFDDEAGALRFVHAAVAPTPVCLILV
jgi:leader peptidase (prepilin peptidase)/N-methyltransferase